MSSRCYAYCALDRNGRRSKGHLLLLGGQSPARVLAQSELLLLRGRYVPAWLRADRRLDKGVILLFTRQLQQLLGAGLPLLEALQLLRRQDESAFAWVLASVIEAVESGSSFADALAVHPQLFDRVYLAVVRVGERSGSLLAMLDSLAQTQEWQLQVQRQWRSVLAYPLLAALAVAGAVLFLLLYLVPQLALLLEGGSAPLPLYSRALLLGSELLREQGVMLLLAGGILLTSMFAAWRYSRCLQHKVAGMAMAAWWLGPVLLRLNIARYSHALGLMYAAGLPLLEALRLAAELVTNQVLRHKLDSVCDRVEAGASLSESLAWHQGMPALLVRMALVGEQSGRLDQVLIKLAEIYRAEAEQSVQTAQSLLGPLLTLLVAGLLIWIIVGLFFPLYDTLAGSV